MRKERSLEEWQQYLERQIEAARRKKEGKPASETSEGGGVSEEASLPISSEEAVAPATSKDAISSVSTEGRALLSWGTTSPLSSIGGEKSGWPLPERRDKPPSSGNGASALVTNRLTSTTLPRTENRLTPPAENEPSPRNGEASTETAPQPLKPYQPSDPRWRSSVAPPPRLRSEPVTRTGHTPTRIPIPMNEEEKLTAEALKEPEVLATEGADSAAEPESSTPYEADEVSEILRTGKEGKGSRKRAPRVTTKKASSLTAAAQETAEEAQALWDRVPRHVQALIRTQTDEVAQNSYKNFRETRSDLIQRLLDPELTLEEAARVLGVCPTTVRRYTNRDLLPHHRTPGNQRRFRLSHVLEFMERFGVTLNEPEGETCDEPDESWEGSSNRLEEGLLSVASGSPS